MTLNFKKSVLILLLFIPGFIFGQQYTRHTPLIGTAKVSVGYLERLPDDYYSDSAKQYPCIIFLHGSGQRGTGTDYDLKKVASTALPKNIQNGHKMCFTNPVTKVVECFIVLSPQTNKWSWRYDGVIFARWALQNYRIDPSRMYLTGLSMGGEGTWFNACFSDNEPNLWAAIAPVCGRASYTDGQNVAKKKIPVWAFHGSADTAIPVTGLLNPVLGMKSIAGNVSVLTIYENQPHYIWDRSYNPTNAWHKPNVYEWFLTKRKP
jgi:predicted peptidase